MAQNNNISGKNKNPKQSTIIIISFLVCCMFPILFLIFIPVLIVTYASKKKTDTYSPNHKTNIGGSGEGVREEILIHEKPIDYNKSTYEIYNELINKKTDYSGVNKDLL